MNQEPLEYMGASIKVVFLSYNYSDYAMGWSVGAGVSGCNDSRHLNITHQYYATFPCLHILNTLTRLEYYYKRILIGITM